MPANRSSLAAVLALVAGALATGGSVACRKTATTTTPLDAGGAGGAGDDATAALDAAMPKPLAGPLEAHVVARIASANTHLMDLQNGKVVFDSGVFVYELTPGGTAKMIGDTASYAKQLPKDDDQLGGYDVEPLPHRKLELPAGFELRPRHDVRLDRDLHGREIDPTWSIAKEIDLPAEFEAERLAYTADGRAIVIGRASRTGPPVTLIAPKGKRESKVLMVPELADAANERIRCEHVASWATPHLRCDAWNNGLKTTLHRLEGERWERIKRADDTKTDVVSAAVGHDDTLWLGLREGSVVRITKAGVIDTIAVPRSDAKLLRPVYHASEEYGLSAPKGKTNGEGPDEQARRWESVDIYVESDLQSVDRVSQILPRPDGEAWALVSEGGATLLAHIGRPPMAPPADPIVMGSQTDQRNEVRHTRPPVPWVGHCPQLFVPIVKQRADGSFDSAAGWARQSSLVAIFQKARGPRAPGGESPRGAMVEGRLGGRRVLGVLVWRASPSASEEVMEKAVNAIADDQRKLAGLAPDITCTAPVLERAALF